MSKSQIEARLQKLEETNAPTKVMIFDSQQEFDEYTGKANLLIVDDIPRSEP